MLTPRGELWGKRLFSDRRICDVPCLGAINRIPTRLDHNEFVHPITGHWRYDVLCFYLLCEGHDAQGGVVVSRMGLSVPV